MGATDTMFCVLTSLALWLEMQHFRWNPNALLSPYVLSFTDDISVPAGGKKSKEIASNAFTRIFKMEEFADAGDVAIGLGSHSICKFASTHAHRSGCSRDNKDLRGRWTSKSRVSDVYDDTELPYPDAKVAEMLCIGGPCYYLFPEELNVTNMTEDNEVAAGVPMIAMMKTFILTNVVPNIRKRMSDAVALVLGKALLWLIFPPYHDITHHVVPQDFKQRIQMEWKEIITATVVEVDCDNALYNPINRVPVVATGDQGCVHINIIPTLDENGDGEILGIGAGGAGGRGVGGMAATAGGLTAQLLAVQSLASQILRELQELRRANQMADRVAAQKCFTTVNAHIRRIALQPGVRVPMGTTRQQLGNDDERTVNAAQLLVTAGVGAAPASLSPNLKNLLELWHEYQVGLGGRKAAKFFTAKERGGKVKHKYNRRNVIWTMVSGLVRSGMTADTAIDAIYAVYGQQTSVTSIINAIKRDKKAGMLNPNLRV